MRLLLGTKLYLAFMDFKKTFDYINRNTLWNVIRTIEMHTKMMNFMCVHLLRLVPDTIHTSFQSSLIVRLYICTNELVLVLLCFPNDIALLALIPSGMRTKLIT